MCRKYYSDQTIFELNCIKVILETKAILCVCILAWVGLTQHASSADANRVNPLDSQKVFLNSLTFTFLMKNQGKLPKIRIKGNFQLSGGERTMPLRWSLPTMNSGMALSRNLIRL